MAQEAGVHARVAERQRLAADPYLAVLQRPYEIDRGVHLHGREDRMLPVAVGYYLAENLPNAQLHVLPHAGHWIQIEQAVGFTAQAKLFLAE
ncbi:alpha/beta fold hydrolase [Streptomyces sp. JNUCC 63]